MQLDLSLLLRPSLYAPVPTTHLASPFLDSSTQPPPDTDLETLLSQRRFIHAADKATDILTSGSIPPSSTQRILDLLYTRFSCLVLCNQSSLAAKEAKPLSELLARESSSYTRPHREVFLSQVPWSLRLLLLKLSVLGTADLHRRAIMGLYGLSSECRVLAQKARVEKDDTAFKLWKYRLGDLGLRVAGELIEMGELETAKRHLDTLSFAAAAASTDNADDDTNGKMCMRKTLLLLKIGDTQAAKKCLSSYSTHSTPSSTLQSQILEPLLHFSTSSYDLALSSLLSLTEQHPSNPLLKHNLAIAYLYTNNVTLASEILEALVTEDEVLFPALLVNLSTVYELRTERARERKLELVDRVAEMGGRSGGNQEMQVGGFEREMAEFKLA